MVPGNICITHRFPTLTMLTFQGHSSSNLMAYVASPHMISYWRLILLYDLIRFYEIQDFES